MYYQALATDYDGTLAHDGSVPDSTLAALEALRRSGRRLIMVTGRELDDLARVFPHMDLFDLIVAENGALLYRPKTKQEVLLADPPPLLFRQRLESFGFQPLSIGRVIVATVEPHETEVLATIRELGLELQIIFNKGAVMVLPPGVNKASGLRAALRELKLSAHNAVGIGDAENDFALLELCGCGVAVANAIPMLKQAADITTEGARGDGVAELARLMMKSDLKDLVVLRQQTAIGKRADGSDLALPPRSNLLLTGSSGAGKAQLADRILDCLARRHYQVCIIDPEGDHASRRDALVLGTSELPPGTEPAKALDRSDGVVVFNLAALAPEERPEAARELLFQLSALRARAGRPHWILLEKAHLALPAEFEPEGLLARPGGLFLVTVHPELVAPSMLAAMDLVLAIGDAPGAALAGFAKAVGRGLTEPVPAAKLASGMALAWEPAQERPVERVEIRTPSERRRPDAA